MRELFNQMHRSFIALPRPAQWVSGSIAMSVFLASAFITVVSLGSWVTDMRQAGQAAKQTARYKGYHESSSRLADVLSTYRQELAMFAYPDSGDSGRSGALLQQDLRRISERSGVVVVGSEVNAPVETEGLVELRVQLNLTGPAGAMDELFRNIQAATPLLFVERLEMQGPRQSRRRAASRELSENISAQLHVLAYRVSACC